MIGYRPWPLVKISWLFLTPGLCLVCAHQCPLYPLLPLQSIPGDEGQGAEFWGSLGGRSVPSVCWSPRPSFLTVSWFHEHYHPAWFLLHPFLWQLCRSVGLPDVPAAGLLLPVCLEHLVSPPFLLDVTDALAHGLRWRLLSTSRSTSVSNCAPSPRRGFVGPSCICACPPPVSLGHFFLLLEQVHTSQIQQRLCVPGLGILHWLVPGWLLHGLCPSLHHRHPLEDPGFLQEGRGWESGPVEVGQWAGHHGWGSSEARQPFCLRES